MTDVADFPHGIETEKEANEYGLYEANVEYLKNNPIGTYCGYDGNVCLANEDVLDFLSQFAIERIVLAYSVEGEQYDPDEDGDVKCVQTLYFQYKKDAVLTEEYRVKMINTPEFKEVYDQFYTVFTGKVVDEKRLLSEYFSHLVYLAKGSLIAQGLHQVGWLMFDTE